MPSVSGQPTPIEPQKTISAAMGTPEEIAAELKEAKATAKTDGAHNIVVVNKDDPQEHMLYHMEVSEIQLDELELGQKVDTGKIQGTIKFMDYGGDDGVAPTAPVKQAEAVGDPMYSLSANDAADFVLGLAVWGFGGPEDEDQFERNYSTREKEAMISEFQADIGVAKTGKWDQATFVGAKEFLISEYDDEETLTDAQFRNFIDDILNYTQGKVSRDDVEENLDGYMYDLLVNPINTPQEPDTAGFAQLMNSLSEAEKNLLPLAIDEYPPDEIAEVMPFLTGEIAGAEAQKILEEEFFDKEDAPALFAPGANVAQELQKAIMKEVQVYSLDIPEDEASGVMDQKTYDAIKTYYKEDFDLDMNSEQLRTFTNSAMKEFLAYARGELDDAQLESKLEALAEQ